MADLLVRGARLVPLDGEAPGEPVDLRIADGVVVEVGPGLAASAPVLDAAGRWVIPGLWDAHVHLEQWARALTWVDVAGSPGPDAVVARMAAALAGRPGERAVVGFGYRSAGWARPATTAALDAVTGDRPVVVIAGDVHNGWLNSAAQRALGVGPVPGPLAEAPWFEVFGRLTELPGTALTDADVAAAVARAAASGVVGLVDLELGDAFDAWPGRVARGIDRVRVRAGVYPHQLDAVVARGLRTGDALDPTGLVTMGPLKVISDGSLSTRTAWCCDAYADGGGHGAHNLPPDELAALVTRATASGLGVAVHAIGDRANTVALDAITAAGASGSVEHAQLLQWSDVGRFAALGVVASVQPPHLLDDRDLAEALWAGRCERCFVFRSLLDAGASLAFGSDAPVSPLDPWLAIAAAVHRSDDDRDGWHAEQSLTPAEAIACSVDGVRLRPGAPGDLVVLGADPLAGGTPAQVRDRLRTMPVVATVCAGRVTHRAG